MAERDDCWFDFHLEKQYKNLLAFPVKIVFSKHGVEFRFFNNTFFLTVSNVIIRKLAEDIYIYVSKERLERIVFIALSCSPHAA